MYSLADQPSVYKQLLAFSRYWINAQHGLQRSNCISFKGNSAYQGFLANAVPNVTECKLLAK